MQQHTSSILKFGATAAALAVGAFAVTSNADATPVASPVAHLATAAATAASLDTAMFAGGCFWSMERPFDHMPGVTSTTVGYAGGHTSNPTYAEVGTRTTGHAETVQVVFDSSKVSYDKLLDVYWHNIDPVTKNAQFCDGGSDYRTIVFYSNPAQKAAAEASEKVVQNHFKSPVATEIIPTSKFWRAEEYHQHFAERNPAQYNAYRVGCGRDELLTKLWGAAAEPYVPKL